MKTTKITFYTPREPGPAERILDGDMSEHDSEYDEGPPCSSPSIFVPTSTKTHQQRMQQRVAMKQLMYPIAKSGRQ